MKKIGALIGLTVLLCLAGFAWAEEFNWKQCEGQTIKILFNQHPYAEGIIKKLQEFEALTGIKVVHTTIPEENYFDKLTTSLSSRSGEPDVFMTGAYQCWDYSTSDYMVDLDAFLKDPKKTAGDYDYDDFFPGISGALRWDRVPGHRTGKGPQWALPIGFEDNVLMYNTDVFAKFGAQPPKTISELLELSAKLNEFDGKGTYGIALRGTRNWATIHPEYMTTYTNYGAVDLAIEDGKLVSKVNSPEAVAMTDMWVKLVKAGGSPTWSSYTWYQCGADIGAKKAAMMFGADSTGNFQSVPGASSQAGKIAFAPPPLPDGQKEIRSNLWVWSLAMNASSQHQDAAWLFIQYFTSKPFQTWSVTEWKSVDPPRKSVFENPKFQEIIAAAPGFKETFEATVPGTTVYFTPNPYFFELATEWAATLQDLVAGKYGSTQEAMDQLKAKMDKALADVEVKE